jgi:hypothetical protein
MRTPSQNDFARGCLKLRFKELLVTAVPSAELGPALGCIAVASQLVVRWAAGAQALACVGTREACQASSCA